MQQLKHLLFTVLVALCSVTAFAHDFDVDGIYYNYNDDGTSVEVTYKGDYPWDYTNWYTGVVTIPSYVTYDGNMYSVTSIRDNAFKDCSRLTSVVIPESVTSIGNYAFDFCSGLTSVTIGNSVTSIGNKAFFYCSSLTSIAIPNSVTCIGWSAFEYCTNLTSVTIGNSVRSIDYFAFRNTALYDNADNWDNGVLYIDGCLIKANTSVSDNYIVKDGTKIIAAHAFYGCNALTSATIPNSVRAIGNNAFNSCSSLTSVTIPNSVTSIGSGAFDDCNNLREIISLNVTPPTVESGCFYYVSTSDCVIKVPAEAVKAYKAADGWKDFENIVALLEAADNVILYTSSDGNVVEPYKSDVFGANIISNTYEYGQGSIVFDREVTTIGDYSFYGCTSLTSIEIPNSVLEVGRSTFMGCSNLTSFTGKFASDDHRSLIFDGVLKAFASAGLTSYEIPNSVTEIGISSFYYCTNLTSVVIPNSVTKIEYGAFFSCTGLTSVEIPNSVTEIGSQSFDHCSSLTSVKIGNSVTEIGRRAFMGCESLTSLVIGNSVETIGIDAFNACTNLTSLEIPNSVTKIEVGAFCGCRSLTSVEIPASVTEIGGKTFSSCSSLKEITSLNTTPPTVESDTFEGLPISTCVLKVPYEALSSYKAAEGWKEFENIVALEETEITLAISPAEYATLTLPFDAEVPEGLTAYTCDVVNGSTLVLKTSDEIKACTPYIIKGAYAGNAAADGECLARPENGLGLMTNTYTFKGYPVATTGQYEVGQLVGTLEDIYAPQGSYVLQSQDGVVGFYRVATDNIMVKANRAYLKAQASGIRAFTFSFTDDDETAISPVVAAEKDTETYSLSGLRVGKDYKGIVVKNGKKFLNR